MEVRPSAGVAGTARCSISKARAQHRSRLLKMLGGQKQVDIHRFPEARIAEQPATEHRTLDGHRPDVMLLKRRDGGVGEHLLLHGGPARRP